MAWVPVDCKTFGLGGKWLLDQYWESRRQAQQKGLTIGTRETSAVSKFPREGGPIQPPICIYIYTLLKGLYRATNPVKKKTRELRDESNLTS